MSKVTDKKKLFTFVYWMCLKLVKVTLNVLMKCLITVLGYHTKPFLLNLQQNSSFKIVEKQDELAIEEDNEFDFRRVRTLKQ